MKQHTNFYKINCPLCGTKTYSILYPSTLTKTDFNYESLLKSVKNTLDDYSKHTQIVKCSSCYLVYSNPREDLDEILDAYSEVVDEEYLATEKFRKILLQKHLRSVNKYKNSGKILDIGSFAGYFLELAKAEGWDTHGIEPSSWASKIATERGIKHIGKDILSARVKPNTYDAVTMWDVIEHLPEPHKVIEKINSMLKKDGILAIGTPDIESLFAKILGKRCPFLIRMHIILYSRRTMERLLTEHGFKILEVSYYGRTFPVSYIIDRIQTRRTIVNKFLTMSKKSPFVANSTITVNFRDSLRIIAQKK